MASQAKEFKKGIHRKQPLTLGVRVLLILLVWCVQMLYVPTSHRTFGGIEPKLPIDNFPTRPVWVLPYVLCYPLWLTGAVWAIFKMPDRLFRSMVSAFLLTCTISVSIYILFPTYVKTASLKATDFFSSLLRSIYKNDGRYNAFPSGHVYITTLLALFYNRWYPRYKAWWISIPVIISLSTLYTHQHFIVDILGGVVVALIGYYFGLFLEGFDPLLQQTRNFLKPRSSK